MKMIAYIYYGIFIISMILIFFTYKQYNKSVNLINNGIKTTAKVIDLIQTKSYDGYTYKPVYEYKDRKAKTIVFESAISSSPAPHKIGDMVKIIYANNGEERKIVSFWGLYRWTIILPSIAAPLLIIGGGYLLYSRG